METSMKFKDKMESEMISFLQGHDCIVFIGGSRRFGYSTSRSDIDLMVLVKGGWKNEVSLVSDLRSMGFTHNHQSVYENSATYVLALGNLFHLTLFIHEATFTDLKIEHAKIEAILKKNPAIRDFVISLRESKEIKGAEIYRLLRKTFITGG